MHGKLNFVISYRLKITFRLQFLMNVTYTEQPGISREHKAESPVKSSLSSQPQAKVADCPVDWGHSQVRQSASLTQGAYEFALD